MRVIRKFGDKLARDWRFIDLGTTGLGKYGIVKLGDWKTGDWGMGEWGVIRQGDLGMRGLWD